MEEKRLKVDFLLIFWIFLIFLNLMAMAASWYISDMGNYWFCAIMLLYCIAGAYLSIPKEKEK